MKNKRLIIALAIATAVVIAPVIFYVGGGLWAESMMITNIHNQVSADRLQAACDRHLGDEWEYTGPTRVDGEVVVGGPFDIPELRAEGGPTVDDNLSIACRLNDPATLKEVKVNVSNETNKEERA